MSAITTGFVSGFVQSFLASVAFQLASDKAKEQLLKPDFQDNLTQALQNFEDEQRKRHPDEAEWHDILEDVKRCIPCKLDAVLKDVLETGAKREVLLERWINRSLKHPQYRDDVQMFCEGWVAVLFQKLYDNPGVEEAFSKIKADLTYQNTEDIKSLVIQIKAMLENLTKHQEQASSTSTNAPKEYSNKYKRDWNKPLFLNDERRNRRACQVCLCQVYIPHRYLFGDEGTPSSDTDYPLLDELAKNGGHLVLGDPGIGKSTLITRYLNESEDTREKRVYRLSEFSLTGAENRPGDVLLQQMGLQIEKLENTILFLDGLDECELIPEKRSVFLQNLQRDWDEWEDRFSWVVTCRRHYLSDRDSDLLRLHIPYLRLLPLNPTQIEEFLVKYEETSKTSINKAKRAALISKKYSGEHGSIFGIPLILYMTARMSEIQVTEESTLVSVYDQLFEKLFERAYDTQKHVLLKDEQRRAIQTMDRHIALWMLLNEPEKAVIPREKYDGIYNSIYKTIETPTDGQVERLYLHEFHSYMHHTEGDSERCYIHRTMYEYFVADGFVAEALKAKNVDELSCVIAWYWHRTIISPTIQEYVTEKLTRNRDKLDFTLWEMAGLRLLEKGVERCFAPGTESECLRPEPCDTLALDRNRENSVLRNLSLLLQQVQEMTEHPGRVFESFNEPPNVLVDAIRHCAADNLGLWVCCPYFYLSKIRLSGVDLSGADFSDADLSDAHLSRAKLTGTDLSHANLNNAKMSNAVLSHAHLSGADLSGADLSNADLSNADLSSATLISTNLSHAKMTLVNLLNARLPNVNLSNAELSSANLSGAVLSGADLSNAGLLSAVLSNANLSFARLANADLSHTVLFRVVLSGTDLSYTCLNSTDLSDADLSNAVLTKTQVVDLGKERLSNCIFDKIRIKGDWLTNTENYSREEFFSAFFPDQP